MASIQFAELWPQLMGLVPVYTRDGINGTSILLENSPALFSEVKTKTLLRRLSNTFLIDLRLAQRAFSQVCGRKYAIPVAFRPGLVMVPVHSRFARAKDDGTRAYLVKDKILKYLPEEPGQKGRGQKGRLLKGMGAVGGMEAVGAMGANVIMSTESGLEMEPTGRGTRIIFTDNTALVVPHRWPNVRDVMVAAELVEREAARLIGYLVDKTGCEVKDNPENRCCKRCPRRDLCFPEED